MPLCGISRGKHKKMKNSKVRKYFGKGRKWVFTLALFLLVFAVASVMKIHAGTSDSGQGWLWGGGTQNGSYPPADGTNTNVGWVSINSTNCDTNNDGKSEGGSGCPTTGTAISNYGVNIPSGNGDVTGYAWSENVGWISFNAADTAGCPQNPCGAVRVVGNNIKGWARILGIKDALAAGNSGGWQGWISLSGGQYGVKINQDNTLTGFGWNGEDPVRKDGLGWIDFSRAKIKTCSPMTCSTKILCEGASFSSCDGSSFCGSADAACALTSGTAWTCSDGCGTVNSCSASIQPKTDGKCGGVDGGSFCQARTPTDADLCSAGTPNPGASSINVNSYQTDWQCQGTCGGSTASCSAKGTKACGWIETNP